MPAVGESALSVDGLTDLRRAFNRADKKLGADLRETLRDVADPVKSDAERRAIQEISSIGPKWSVMRVGFTRHTVYVAPKQRGRFTKKNAARYARPNLGDLLAEKAMEPALAANIGEAERRLGHLLDNVGREWERA